jgi:hypothetical protein
VAVRGGEEGKEILKECRYKPNKYLCDVEAEAGEATSTDSAHFSPLPALDWADPLLLSVVRVLADVAGANGSVMDMEWIHEEQKKLSDGDLSCTSDPVKGAKNLSIILRVLQATNKKFGGKRATKYSKCMRASRGVGWRPDSPAQTQGPRLMSLEVLFASPSVNTVPRAVAEPAAPLPLPAQAKDPVNWYRGSIIGDMYANAQSELLEGLLPGAKATGDGDGTGGGTGAGAAVGEDAKSTADSSGSAADALKRVHGYLGEVYNDVPGAADAEADADAETQGGSVAASPYEPFFEELAQGGLQLKNVVEGVKKTFGVSIPSSVSATDPPIPTAHTELKALSAASQALTQAIARVAPTLPKLVSPDTVVEEWALEGKWKRAARGVLEELVSSDTMKNTIYTLILCNIPLYSWYPHRWTRLRWKIKSAPT